MLDQEQRHPAVAQLEQIGGERGAFARVQPRGGLIDEQQPGIRSGRARQLDAAPVAEGEVLGECRCERFESEPRERVVGAVRALAFGAAGRGQREEVAAERRAFGAKRPGDDVFEYGHFAEETCVLKRSSDAEGGDAVRLPAGNVGAADRHAALAGPADSADRVEQRRLAGTVGADQRRQRSAREREAHVVHRNEPAEPLRNMRDLNRTVTPNVSRDRHQVRRSRRSLDQLGMTNGVRSGMAFFFEARADEAEGAAGRGDHDADNEDSVDDLARVLELVPADVEKTEQRRADQRARHAAAAAEHDHQEQAERKLRAHGVRHDDAEKCSIDRAGEPRQRTRIGERQNLIAARRHAQDFGRQLVVTNRFERATRTAAQQVEREQRHDECDDPREPIGGITGNRQRTEARIRDVLDADRAAEEFRFVKNAGADQAEGKGCHREIVAAKTQRDEAEAEADQRRAGDPDQRRERPRDPRRHVPPRRQRCDRVGTDAEKPGCAERNLVDVAEQEREPDRRDREDRRVRPRLGEGRVAAREDAEDDDDQREHRQRARVGTQTRDQSRTALRAPKSPCGRTKRATSSSE